jgi:hypothetical protein
MTRRRKGANEIMGKFAPIPIKELKESLGALSCPEFRVWIALCAQSQRWCNGTAKLTLSVIREFHLGSKRNVSDATRKLIELGLVKRTRTARQRVCALYGVTHLALNADALAKEGVNIRTALYGNSGGDDPVAVPTGEPLVAVPHRNRNRYHVGTAKAPSDPLAVPQGNRIGPFPSVLAVPQGNTSKNMPSATDQLGNTSRAADGSDSGSESTSLGAPDRARPLEIKKRGRDAA